MIKSVYPRNNYFCASTDDKIGSKKELPRWQMHNGLFAFLGYQVNNQGEDTEGDHQHTSARKAESHTQKSQCTRCKYI